MKNQIEQAVEAILDKYHSACWFGWKIVARHVTTYKQKGTGRPGKNTEYVKLTKDMWTFEAMPNGARLKEDAERDGMFPMITNIRAEELPMRQLLLK